MKKVLLLGDSIRMGYDEYVREILKGKAEVYFEEDDFDGFMEKLETLADIESVHPVYEHRWDIEWYGFTIRISTLSRWGRSERPFTGGFGRRHHHRRNRAANGCAETARAVVPEVREVK